jgi:tetraacyldisaccharide 4'-kinase
VVDQLVYTSSLLKMGEGTAADRVIRQAARAGKPIYEARTRPRGRKAFAGKRFLAFAGIGHPDKFFDTVTGTGAVVVLSRAFPDHHVYGEDELAELLKTARDNEMRLITTAKDAARLRHGAASAEFLEMLDILEIDAVFEQDYAPTRVINETLEAWRLRRLKG